MSDAWKLAGTLALAAPLGCTGKPPPPDPTSSDADSDSDSDSDADTDTDSDSDSDTSSGGSYGYGYSCDVATDFVWDGSDPCAAVDAGLHFVGGSTGYGCAALDFRSGCVGVGNGDYGGASAYTCTFDGAVATLTVDYLGQPLVFDPTTGLIDGGRYVANGAFEDYWWYCGSGSAAR